MENNPLMPEVPLVNSVGGVEEKGNKTIEEIKMEEYQRGLKEGVYRGESTTFHDYSKDLTSLDIQMREYFDEASSIQKKLLDLINKLKEEEIGEDSQSLVGKIEEETKKLSRLPNQDYLLRLRFMMDHLRTKTEGRFYGAPEYCQNYIKGGTKRDIYLLVNKLVFITKSWKGWQNKVAHQNEEQGTDNLLQWAQVFVFEEPDHNNDTVYENTEERKSIGKVVNKIFSLGITLDKYNEAFPRPILNKENTWDDQVLWSNLTNTLRETSPRDLLPLLVFSLRTAYQHAYFRTILKASDITSLDDLTVAKREDIRLIGKENGPHKYKIEIHFPEPDIEKISQNNNLNNGFSGTNEEVNLPYGDWERQMSHYIHKVGGWEWKVEKVSGPVSEDGSDPWHYVIALFN